MNETDFRKAVVKHAHHNGWKVAFFHRLPTQKGGWRTPVGADGKGWPDLVLVRERVLFVELKGNDGRLHPDQKLWLNNLAEAGAEVYVWRPRDWHEVERVLSTPHGEREQRLEAATGGDHEQAEAVKRMLG